MNLLDVDKFAADKMRAIYWEKYGTSLAGLMKNYKINPDDFLNNVHDIDFSVLPKDLDLLDALNNLPGRKLVYTNGTVPYAREVLKYRGLLDVFSEIYGIEDATYVPKPFPKAFENTRDFILLKVIGSSVHTKRVSKKMKKFPSSYSIAITKLNFNSS